MTSLNNRLINFREDLLSLEVNTIIKSNITGRKMPNVRHALMDINIEYYEKLLEFRDVMFKQCQLSFNVRDLDDNGNETQAFQELKQYPGSLDAFIWTRRKSNNFLKAILSKMESDVNSTPEQLELMDDAMVHLRRMKYNCDQIRDVLSLTTDQNKVGRGDVNTSPILNLKAKSISIIRKIWEVGTEDIAMQTIVQLDGDVISRIGPKHAKSDNLKLLDFHTRGIDISLKYWETIIKIVKSFFS